MFLFGVYHRLFVVYLGRIIWCTQGDTQGNNLCNVSIGSLGDWWVINIPLGSQKKLYNNKEVLA